MRSGVRRALAAPKTAMDTTAISPDGRFVTYQSGSDQVVVPVSGGEPVQHIPLLPKLSGSVPHFTPDGKGIAYVDRTGLAIVVQSISGGAPHQLVAFPDRPIGQFAWSPDGKQLAILRALTVSDIVLLTGVK